MSSDTVTAPRYPLASVQEAIWLDQVASQNFSRYNIGGAARIEGDLDIERLERSLQVVADSSDAMRLRLQADARGVWQKILPSIRVSLPLIDLSDQKDGDDQARDYLRRALRQPIAPDGPLWESWLIRVHPQRHYWVYRTSHLILDGVGLTRTLLA